MVLIKVICLQAIAVQGLKSSLQTDYILKVFLLNFAEVDFVFFMFYLYVKSVYAEYSDTWT